MKNALICFILITVAVFLPAGLHARLPGLVVTPDPLNFGDVKVGDDPVSRTLTITRQISLPVTIISSGVGDTTNFSIADDGCANKTIFGGQSCNVIVSFQPLRGKHFVTYLTLTLSGRTVDNVSVIEGNGIAPEVTVVPKGIDFGNQTINKSSIEYDVEIINSGTTTLNITDITTASPFSATSTCGPTLAVWNLCSAGVTFTPVALGDFTGNLVITDDASDSPQTVALSGTGVAPGQPSASLSRREIDFGNQLVGTTSDAENVTLGNTGTANLAIASITPSAEFGVTDDCGADLAPDTGCNLAITFSPTAEGAQAGQVTVTDNASDSPQTVTLAGTGTVHDGPKAIFSTTAIDFGIVEENTTSAAQPYTITNDGDEDLVIDDIEMVGDDAVYFSAESDCQATLPPGGTCQGDVAFTPRDQATYTAAIQFTDNTSDSPQTITLTGTASFPQQLGGGGCSLNQ